MYYAELQQANRSYGPVAALKDVDIHVRSGELVALLGPNGAGKTTAVRAMLGLTPLDAGTAMLFGMAPQARAARRRTGVMLQQVNQPATLRVREQIDLFSSYYPSPLARAEVLSMAGLERLEDRLCRQLSGGESRKVAFALAICGNPELLFLDEPTVGMDVKSRRKLWSAIRAFVQRGGSVLLTTHYLEEADALADRVVMINRGRIIAEGSPSEIKARTSWSVIRCSTRLDAVTLLGLPHVFRARHDKQRVEILTADPACVLRELLARDASLGALEVVATGLEDAFLNLMERDEKAMAEVAG